MSDDLYEGLNSDDWFNQLFEGPSNSEPVAVNTPAKAISKSPQAIPAPVPAQGLAPKVAVKKPAQTVAIPSPQPPLVSPAWEQAEVGYPASFARSALFRAGEGQAGGGWLINESIPLPASKGILMEYSGPRLNQKHALVFQALIEATAGAAHDLVIPHGDVLKLINLKNSTFDAHTWLWKHFKDMMNARIVVETDRVKYYGGLIHSIAQDKRTGMLAIALDHRLAGLFANEVIRSSTLEKAALGNSQITLWLHSYVSSHLKIPPVSVNELKRISGSDRPLKIFRFKLKKAFEELATGPNPLIKSWQIVDDKVMYEKRDTKVKWLSNELIKARAADKVKGKKSNASRPAKVFGATRSGLVL